MSDPKPVEQPFDHASERTVVGAFLRGAADGDALVPGVKPADFYAPEHRRVMEAVAAVQAAGVPLTTAAVLDRLVDDGMLEAAGGPDALREAVNDSGDVEHAASVVRGLAKLRRLMHAMQDVDEAGPAGAPDDRRRPGA